MPEAFVGCKCGRIHVIRAIAPLHKWSEQHADHGGFAYFYDYPHEEGHAGA